MPHAVPTLPWLKVGSDIFQHAGKYFLIIVDYFSKFVEVNPLTNIGTKAVVTAMRDQFARHGIPQEVVTDNGPAYASKEFAEFSAKWGFQHITTSPYYAQSNGLSERSVQTVKNILIKSITSGSDFYLGLLNYRATPRDGVSSPSELLMGRRLNTRLPTHVDKLKPSRNNDLDYANMLNKRQNDKKYYDSKSKPLVDLQPGQPVVIADEDRRFARVVGRAPQPRSYFVADGCGRRYRRNRRHLIKLEIPKSEGNAIDRNDVNDAVSIPSTSHAPTSPTVQHTRRPAALKAREKLIDLKRK